MTSRSCWRATVIERCANGARSHAPTVPDVVILTGRARPPPMTASTRPTAASGPVASRNQAPPGCHTDTPVSRPCVARTTCILHPSPAAACRRAISVPRLWWAIAASQPAASSVSGPGTALVPVCRGPGGAAGGGLLEGVQELGELLVAAAVEEPVHGVGPLVEIVAEDVEQRRAPRVHDHRDPESEAPQRDGVSPRSR